MDKCCSHPVLKGQTVPKRQYLKAVSQDQYDKIIGKDAYAFLHGHEEEIIETLTVGKEVSDDFKTLTESDVKTVYWIIISEIEKTGWSSADMSSKLQAEFPQLQPYQADRIIRTELTRIINYAKEFIAERGDLGEYLYGWTGPLDSRTTPMCYYLQTGELRESDITALHRTGHDVSELPEIPEEGLPLEELKQACRTVSECFGYDMISDWVMHVNCRHTFARGNRRLDLEIAEPSEIDQIVNDLMDLPGGFYEDDTTADLIPEAEDGKLYFRVYDSADSYIFINSIYHVPVMYDNPSAEDVFVFEEMNEKDVASWSRLVLQLREENLDDITISWALQDTGNIEESVLSYILIHADEINRRAENEGWYY